MCRELVVLFFGRIFFGLISFFLYIWHHCDINVIFVQYIYITISNLIYLILVFIMLVNITSNTFLQLSNIIKQLGDKDFSEKLEVLNYSSIGQHVRHVLEFYICLAQGLKVGKVDYDNRSRDLSIENDPKYAMMILEELRLVFCCDEIEDTVLINTIDFNDVIINAKSSVRRELIYLIEHSIHHYAIIDIALRSHFRYVEIPQNFGVAYSTSKHKKSLGPELVHQH